MPTKSIRSRNWSLVTYLPVDILLVRLCSLDNVQSYCYCVHDRDVLPDGSPKPYHVHLALILKSARTLQQIAPRFSDIDSNAGNCFGEPTRSNKAIVTYFTHVNEPEKFQYSVDDLHSNNLSSFLDDSQTDDCTFNIIDDILNGTPLYTLAKIYGRDFVYHYRDIKLFVDDVRAESFKK